MWSRVLRSSEGSRGGDHRVRVDSALLPPSVGDILTNALAEHHQRPRHGHPIATQASLVTGTLSHRPPIPACRSRSASVWRPLEGRLGRRPDVRAMRQAATLQLAYVHLPKSETRTSTTYAVSGLLWTSTVPLAYTASQRCSVCVTGSLFSAERGRILGQFWPRLLAAGQCGTRGRLVDKVELSELARRGARGATRFSTAKTAGPAIIPIWRRRMPIKASSPCTRIIATAMASSQPSKRPKKGTTASTTSAPLRAAA